MSTDPIFDADLWHRRDIVKVDGIWTVDGRPRTSYKLLRMEQPDVMPGKTFIAILITVPPNSATPPHTHNGAAVYGQVIKGRVISQMIHGHATTGPDGETSRNGYHDSGVDVYGPGEMWYEAPGCHHVRSESAGDEEAAFYANFIIDTEKLKGTDKDNVASVLTILDVDPRSPYYSTSG